MPKTSSWSGPFGGTISTARILPITTNASAIATQPSLIGILREGRAAAAGRGTAGLAGGGATTAGCGTVTWRSSLHSPGSPSRQARTRSRYSPGGSAGASQLVRGVCQLWISPSRTSTSYCWAPGTGRQAARIRPSCNLTASRRGAGSGTASICAGIGPSQTSKKEMSSLVAVSPARVIKSCNARLDGALSRASRAASPSE